MRANTVLSLAAALCTAALASAGAAEDAPDPRPLSPAQIALFESDHFHAIASRAQLRYGFRHDEADGAHDYTDRVELDVRPRPDGKKDVWADFLTGDHHVPFQPALDFRGNPVLMFFLERDVQEMHRLSGGAASYFRNRIRQAFVDRATVREATIMTDGHPAPATEITLVPFRGDPRIAVFPGWTDKTYRFLLLPDVPGTIYEIATEIPGPEGQPPRLTETMTFAGETPCSGDGPCAPASSR